VGRFAEAEKAYRATLKLMPNDPVAHSNLGKFLADQARYHEAKAQLNEAIQLQPEHGSFWVERGWAYANMRRWHKATADFVKATKCKEPDPDAWYARAILHLRAGDQGGYRKICSDMLERFGAEAVWTCTLAANSGADPAWIVSLAEKALAKSPKDHWHVNPNHWDVHRLGAALYRAGRFQEAVQRLTEATERNAHPYRTNMLCTWFFLAMAHQRLGHAEEARRWLEKASRATEDVRKPNAQPPEKSSTAAGTIPPDWARKLTLGLLRREAEELLGLPKDPARGKKDGK
jgi:Flp pilus assembly protein TadD